MNGFARLARGEPLRVLDVFAGAGGLSLGFQRAGFHIAGAVEMDPLAARTHARNFHPEDRERHGMARDMTRIEPQELLDALGLDGIDVLAGGPPCQAYARIGRAKLREIADHPAAFKVDPRGNLYLRYLAWVKALRPLALLVENVPDILHYGHHNVVEEMVEALEALGYVARYSLINSAFHGCPQMRDRVFLIAYRKELGVSVRFPAASRFLRLPRGYAGTRAVALRHVAAGYLPAGPGDESLPGPVTAREAIGDLEPIRGDSVKRGARRFSTLSRYAAGEDFSDYTALMRRWPGFAAGEGVHDHVIRALPRDGPIFSAMRPGAEYPEAHATARVLAGVEAARLGLAEGSAARCALFARMVPPYDVGKFPNRWWKLDPEQPVRTLMAHLGKDTYSHIHWDAAQARTISVREAARLQGFPDGFVFEGTMNPAFRQIGNAVPPLMAAAIAGVMLEMLRAAVGRLAA